ncbi:MAG TPA: hypothetical protein VH063_08350 [Gaiellaceae bacterium]|jgi:hypothetical protein|nr:hypothetical protein [Gaiellaceae bacterium]
MADDFRVTVTFPDDSAADLAAKVQEHDLEEDARKQLGAGISVSADGPNVFLYADTREAAEGAKGIVAAILEKEGAKATITLDRWHPLAEEWQRADAPMPKSDAEREAEHERLEAQDTADSLASGFAEWEVQIALPSHGDAVELAERLESEGIPVSRRWKHVIVGADDEDDANALVTRLRGEAPAGAEFTVEPGGEMAWEGAPKRSRWFYFVPNM